MKRQKAPGTDLSLGTRVIKGVGNFGVTEMEMGRKMYNNDQENSERKFKGPLKCIATWFPSKDLSW